MKFGFDSPYTMRPIHASLVSKSVNVLTAQLAGAHGVIGDALVLSERLLLELEFDAKDRAALVLAAKAVRSRQYLHAIASMSRSPLVGPVANMLRTMLELQFIADALCRHPDYIGDLERSHHADADRALRKLQQVSPENRVDGLSDETLNAMRAQSRINGVSVEDWARRAGRHEEYLTSYTYLSTRLPQRFPGRDLK